MKILDNYHLGITLVPNLFVILIMDIIFKLPVCHCQKAWPVEDQGTAGAGPGRRKL